MNTIQKIWFVVVLAVLSSHALFSQISGYDRSNGYVLELDYSELRLCGKNAVFEKYGLTQSVRDSVTTIVITINGLYADSICITPKNFRNVTRFYISARGYAELEGLQKFKNITSCSIECPKFDYSKIKQWKNLKSLDISAVGYISTLFWTPKYKMEDCDIVFPKNLDTLIIRDINSFDYDSEWFRSNCKDLKYFRFETNVSEEFLESESRIRIKFCSDAEFYSDWKFSAAECESNIGCWTDMLESVVPYIKYKDVRCIVNNNTDVYPISSSLVKVEQDTGIVFKEKSQKFDNDNVNGQSYDEKYRILEENCIVDIGKSQFYGDSLVMYYRNGDVACRGEYKNGLRCGIWCFYTPGLKEEIMQKYYNGYGVVDSVLTPVQSIKSESLPNGMRYVGRIDKEKYLDSMRTVAPPLITQNADSITYKKYLRKLSNWSIADWYPRPIENELATYVLLKDTLHNTVWEIFLANDKIERAECCRIQTMETTTYADDCIFYYVFSTSFRPKECNSYYWGQYVGFPIGLEVRKRCIEKGTDIETDKQKDEFLKEVYKILRYYGYL